MAEELDDLRPGDLLIRGNSGASFLIVEVRKGRNLNDIVYSQKLTAPHVGLYLLAVYDDGRRIMWYDPQLRSELYAFAADFEIVRTGTRR